jgi:hypothetical protein
MPDRKYFGTVNDSPPATPPLRSPAQILREIDRLFHLLPAYDTGRVSPEILIKEAEIRSLVEQFKAANEAIYTRWLKSA